jgi:hypothetical protein
MSTTTPNFGWTIPSDTDLVTDGAAAMRDLGDGIDTSFVDLNGGTTGQILSKTSATDLDFTWITNDVGDITSVGVTSPITGGGSSGAVTIAIQDASTAQKGSVMLSDSTSTTSSILAATPTAVKAAYDLANGAIPKTLTTTTGDTIYASGANTPARLGIGSNGQVLTVASGIPSWATPSTPASGLTFLSATTFSNVATSSTNSVFSGTYSNYRIMLKVKSVTSGSDLSLRLRVSGSDNSTSNYAYVFPYYQMDGAGAGTTKNSAQSSMLLASINSADYSWATYDIFSPQLSESTGVTGNMTLKNGASSSYYMYLFGGLFATTTAFDGFTLIGVSANITGEVRVYGYQNS